MKNLLIGWVCLAAVSLANAEIVLHLPFDVDGTAAAGTDATLVNGASIVPEGMAGGALSLDGIDDYATTVGYKGMGGSAPRTISLWVKTAVNQSAGTFFLGWGNTGTGSRVRYDFGLNSSTTDQMRLELNSGAATSATGTTITDDAWHHLASTWDGATMTFYLDGNAYGAWSDATGVATVLTEDIVIGTGIRQAFGSNTTARWTNGLIDDVQVYDAALDATAIQFLYDNPGTPYIDTAYGPSPVDGISEVAIDTLLSWNAPTTYDNASYHIYFGPTEPNYVEADYGLTLLNSGGPQTELSIDPSPEADLDNLTTYYWIVDSYEPNSTGAILHPGKPWSFTTVTAQAKVETNPINQTVPDGTLVQLTVDGVNITTWHWYKDGAILDGTNPDIALFGGTETTATLEFTASLAGEGVYYCVVDNDLNSPDISAKAIVMTQRLVEYWDFNGTLDATVDAIHTGTYTDPNTANDPPAPVFTAVDDAVNLPGKGQAFIFDDSSRHIQIGGNVDDFNFYPAGYTVSAWINTAQTGYGAYVSKQALTSSQGFLLTHNSGNAIHGLRGQASLSTPAAINDGQWHMVAGTYDAASQTLSLYVDGILVNSGLRTAAVTTNSEPLVLGAELSDGSVDYAGLLDEVRIWSYPRSKEEIGQEYYDVTGVVPCINDFAGSVYDFDDNCIVDLADFAIFAAYWLDNGLLPH